MLTCHEELLVSEYCALVQATKKRHRRFTGTLIHLERLMERYREPWRFYHNIEHIADGLRKLYAHRAYLKNPVLAKWAWFLHDRSFEPGSPTSERCSAKFAYKDLADLGMSTTDAQVVYQMIKATCGHDIPENFLGIEEDLALMLDIDISGLGAPLVTYIAVGDTIRQEFDHLSDAEFRNGNAAFSQGMLNKKRIFKTECFAHLEGQARENLKWAVAHTAETTT